MVEQHGFTLRFWSMPTGDVHPDQDLQIANAQLDNGVDTYVFIGAATGTHRATGKPVDDFALLAFSLGTPSGPLICTGNGRAPLRHQDLKHRQVATMDPAILLARHRKRLRAYGPACRMDPVLAIRGYEDCMASVNEDEIRRGILIHVCDTRDELAAILDQGPTSAAHPPLAPIPPLPTAIPESASPPANDPRQSHDHDRDPDPDPRRRVVTRAKRHPDPVTWTITDHGLTMNGVTLPDAAAISTTLAISPTSTGYTFELRDPYRLHPVPRDFVHLLLRTIDTRHLVTLELAKRYKIAFFNPFVLMFFFWVFSLMCSAEPGFRTDGPHLAGVILLALLAIHLLVHLGACLRPTLAWYRIHVRLILLYTLILLLEAVFFTVRLPLLLFTLAMFATWLVGVGNCRMFEEFQVIDAYRNKAHPPG
jgi:hypothetical protein